MKRETAPNPAWLPEGGTTYLSTGVTPASGEDLSSAPPGTQGPSAHQAPECRDGGGIPIDNTACVIFNSRGIPIDWEGTPTGIGAVYVTDGIVMHGITVSAAGLTQVWQRFASSETWVKQ